MQGYEGEMGYARAGRGVGQGEGMRAGRWGRWLGGGGERGGEGCVMTPRGMDTLYTDTTHTH
jgi:hypothetical protein